MVTMIGLKPRSEMSPLTQADDDPDSQAGDAGRARPASPSMISQPQVQPASAAVPGMDRSSAPQMIPTATPAAKIAVSAAALAMRIGVVDAGEVRAAPRR